MVQTVTLELSALNNIPGVSGVADVEFRIPELSDIREELDQAVPSLDEISAEVDEVVRDALRDVDIFDGQLDTLLDDIGQELDDRLDDLVDDIQTEIDEAVADIDIPGLEDIEVDVGGSLFAVNEDFVELLAAALDQVDFLEVDQFGDVEGLIEDVEGLIEEVGPLLDLTAQDLVDRVTAETEDFLEDIPGGQLLTDPDQFIDDQLERVTDGLVSEEARQDLQDTLEDN